MNRMLKGVSIGLAVLLLLSSCSQQRQVDTTQIVTTTTQSELDQSYSLDTSKARKTADGSQSKDMATGAQSTTKDMRPSSGNSTARQVSGSSVSTYGKTETKTHATTSTTARRSTIPSQVKVACMDTSFFAQKSDSDVVNTLSAIEKEQHMTFKTAVYSASDLADNAIKADKAGSKFADLMITTMWQQKSLLAAGVLRDLNSVKGLNLTKSYWDQAARRDMQLYGKNFIGFTTLDGPATHANVLFFNKTLAKQVGTSDTSLYKMVTDGKWTFKEMIMLSAKALRDLDGNGIDYNKGADQYGFTGLDMRGSVSFAIFKAQGGYFTKWNSQGERVYGLTDAKNISALRTMQTWLLKDKSVFNPDKHGNDHELGKTMFQNGQALFFAGTAGDAYAFDAMNDDWGILPYPKAEVSGQYVSTVNWNIQGFSIPRRVTGADLQNAAAAMEAIAIRFDTIRSQKSTYLNKQVYRDAQTPKMLDIVQSSVIVDFCQFGDLSAGGLTTIHYLYDNVANDPATRVNAVKDEAQARMNTFLQAVKAA